MKLEFFHTTNHTDGTPLDRPVAVITLTDGERTVPVTLTEALTAVQCWAAAVDKEALK